MKAWLKRFFQICEDGGWDVCGCGSSKGTCHICERWVQVKYCNRCKHWFCEACDGRYFARALNATREFLFGRKECCCGPDCERAR